MCLMVRSVCRKCSSTLSSVSSSSWMCRILLIESVPLRSSSPTAINSLATSGERETGFSARAACPAPCAWQERSPSLSVQKGHDTHFTQIGADRIGAFLNGVHRSLDLGLFLVDRVVSRAKFDALCNFERSMRGSRRGNILEDFSAVTLSSKDEKRLSISSVVCSSAERTSFTSSFST